jgi:hypothetical protein
MSAEPGPGGGVGFYLELFQEIISYAQLTGLRGDWSRLNRRLNAIRLRIKADDLGMRTLTPGHAARLVEFDRWFHVLGDVLRPDVGRRLLGELANTDGVPSALWSPLEVVLSDDLTRVHAVREIATESSIYRAAQRCKRAPSVSRVGEALSALEELRVLRSHDLWEDEVLRAAGQWLAVALVRILPPAARIVVVREVRAHVFSLAEEQSILTATDEWRRRWGEPGALRNWRPVWEDIMPGDDEEGALGTYFVPDLQGEYEAIHERRVREQAERQAHEQERVRRAEVERRREAQEQESIKARELDDLLSDLDAWDKDAPRRRAVHMERLQRTRDIAYDELRSEFRADGRRLKAVERTERDRLIEERETEVRDRMESETKEREESQRAERLKAIELRRGVADRRERG